MTKRQKRIREIIRALSDLSREGWRYASPCDYLPLERELAYLQNKEGKGK